MKNEKEAFKKIKSKEWNKKLKKKLFRLII